MIDQMNTNTITHCGKNKLCFSTYVYGWYKDFIPLYIFSILKNFPQHYVKVYIDNELNQKQKKSLNVIESKNFEITNKIPKYSHITHGAAFRFLIPKEHFSDFDYLYMGDVDIITTNERKDNFYEYYVNHMKKTKLPFSNSYSIEKDRKRITGLHFIDIKPYYEKAQKSIDFMKTENKFIKEKRNNHSFDEEMLYKICTSCFDIKPLKGYLRPHHGLHLGYYRIKLMENGFSRCTYPEHRPHKIYGCPICNAQAKRGLRFPKPRNRGWDGVMPTCVYNEINELIFSKEFKYIYKNMGKEVKEIIDRMVKFMNRKEL